MGAEGSGHDFTWTFLGVSLSKKNGYNDQAVTLISG